MASKAYVASMTVTELKQELKQRGLSTRGSKKNLRDRLERAFDEEELNDSSSESDSGGKLGTVDSGFNFSVTAESFLPPDQIREDSPVLSPDQDKMIISVELSNKETLEVYSPNPPATSGEDEGGGGGGGGDRDGPLVVAVSIPNDEGLATVCPEKEPTENHNSIPASNTTAPRIETPATVQQEERTRPEVVDQRTPADQVQAPPITMNNGPPRERNNGSIPSVAESSETNTSSSEPQENVVEKEKTEALHVSPLRKEMEEEKEMTEARLISPPGEKEVELAGIVIDKGTDEREQVRDEEEGEVKGEEEGGRGGSVALVEAQVEKEKGEEMTQDEPQLEIEDGIATKTIPLSEKETVDSNIPSESTVCQEGNQEQSDQQLESADQRDLGVPETAVTQERNQVDSSEPRESELNERVDTSKSLQSAVDQEAVPTEPMQTTASDMAIEEERVQMTNEGDEEMEGGQVENLVDQTESLATEKYDEWVIIEQPPSEQVKDASIQSEKLEEGEEMEGTEVSAHVEESTAAPIVTQTEVSETCKEEGKEKERGGEKEEVDKNNEVESRMEEKDDVPNNAEPKQTKAETEEAMEVEESGNKTQFSESLPEISIQQQQEDREEDDKEKEEKVGEDKMEVEDKMGEEEKEGEDQVASVSKAPPDMVSPDEPKNNPAQHVTEKSSELVENIIQPLPSSTSIATVNTHNPPITPAVEERGENSSAVESTTNQTTATATQSDSNQQPNETSSATVADDPSDLTQAKEKEEEVSEGVSMEVAVLVHAEEDDLYVFSKEAAEAQKMASSSRDRGGSVSGSKPRERARERADKSKQRRNSSTSTSAATTSHPPSSSSSSSSSFHAAILKQAGLVATEGSSTARSAGEATKPGEPQTASNSSSNEETQLSEGDGSKSHSDSPSKKRRRISTPAGEPASIQWGGGERSGERRRRWGSGKQRSSSSTTTNISSDVLKDIIPSELEVGEGEVVMGLEEVGRDQLGDGGGGGDQLNTDNNREKDVHQLEWEEMVRQREMKQRETERARQELETRQRIEARVKARLEQADAMRAKEQERESGKKRTPSPPRNTPSHILHVKNMTRPFTLTQLKELLSEDGPLLTGGFWTNNVKSHCIAVYGSKDVAMAARNRMHGEKWPSTNPKLLSVDFLSPEEVQKISEGELVVMTAPPDPENRGGEEKKEENEKEGAGEVGKKREGVKKENEVVATEEKGVEEKELSKKRRRESSGPEKKEDKDNIKTEDSTTVAGGSNRSESTSGSAPTAAAPDEKTQSQATKLLDDLFKKTKATPAVYWLPLSEDEVKVKQEEREAKEAEREKRRIERQRAYEEERRKEREREREREELAKKERERRIQEERERRARERVRRRSRSRERSRSSRSRSRSRSRSKGRYRDSRSRSRDRYRGSRSRSRDRFRDRDRRGRR